MYTITLPQILKVGAGSTASINDILEQFSCKHPLIVSDKTMLQLGHIDTLLHCMSNKEVSVFTDTMAEPNDESLLPALQLVRKNHHDCLIALGGGSAIDSAKAIALLARVC